MGVLRNKNRIRFLTIRIRLFTKPGKEDEGLHLRGMLNRVRRGIKGNSTGTMLRKYLRRFREYSFTDCECKALEQFDASIIRLYHTIEKGLSYSDYRVGFGRANVDKLIISLQQYADAGYDLSRFPYQTALSCLDEYVKKNSEHSFEDPELLKRIGRLPGQSNHCGGTISITAPKNTQAMPYDQLVKTRHSIRHFSDAPVDIELITEAIELAQYTPSACNRQGWRTRIIADKTKIKKILENQNGNRGFGQEIDKLLVITADLRAQQKNRELFQAFIDGGMYAESILNSLFYKGIGSIPLSASLTTLQEEKIRDIMNIEDAEVLILFIGVGNYPELNFLTTKSTRKPAEIIVE